MRPAISGDTVNVHYRGTLASGEQFDSSEGRDPLQFTLGSGQVIPGFDVAVTGMSPGETKTVTIPSDEAYGPHNEQLVQTIARTDIPEDLNIDVGTELAASDPQGNQVRLVVREVTDEAVKLDANHPLAGQDLTFELTLVDIAA